MTRPAVLFQGEDKTLKILMNEDISAATEIEFYIDTCDQIKKTLSDAQITSVTAAQFFVQIDAADTETKEPGPYKFQARATIAGKKHNIKFRPNKIRILESVFVSQRRIKDYGG